MIDAFGRVEWTLCTGREQQGGQEAKGLAWQCMHSRSPLPSLRARFVASLAGVLHSLLAPRLGSVTREAERWGRRPADSSPTEGSSKSSPRLCKSSAAPDFHHHR